MEEKIKLLASLEEYKNRLKAHIYRPSKNELDMIETMVYATRLEIICALQNVMIEHFLNTSEKTEAKRGK